MLNGSLYWIRASVLRGADTVSDALAVVCQAVTATRVLPDGTERTPPMHLAPNTITGPAEPQAGIAKIFQPFASFGGRAQERAEGLYVRASERLRHKNRAISIWDCERLILDAFPQIYKVKCVPPGPEARAQIVIIPDMRGKVPFNPFTPMAPRSLLKDVAAFLEQRVPPSAIDQFEVVNAQFVPIKLRFAVGLKEMAKGDPSYYTRRLNDDVNRFLAPWAYDDQADISFDARIYANDIVDFIDRRDYVDFCANLKMFVNDADGQPHEALIDPAGYSVRAHCPDQILVPVRHHDISVTTDYADEVFIGIGYMKIALDFQVAANLPPHTYKD